MSFRKIARSVAWRFDAPAFSKSWIGVVGDL